MATSAAYRFTFFATRGAASEHEKSELQLAELNLTRKDRGGDDEARGALHL